MRKKTGLKFYRFTWTSNFQRRFKCFRFSSGNALWIYIENSRRIFHFSFFKNTCPLILKFLLKNHTVHMRDIKSRFTAHHHHRKTLSFIRLYMIVLTFGFEMILLEDLFNLRIPDLFVLLTKLTITVDFAGKIINITIKRLKSAFLPKETDFIVTLLPSSKTPVTSTSLCKRLKTYSGPGLKKVKFAT